MLPARCGMCGAGAPRVFAEWLLSGSCPGTHMVCAYCVVCGRCYVCDRLCQWQCPWQGLDRLEARAR